MRIVVTANDIAAGRAAQAAGDEAWLTCPIAQSLKRRGFQFPVVDDLIRWQHKNRQRFAVLPQRVTEWIADFDEGSAVKPIAFNLEGQP